MLNSAAAWPPQNHASRNGHYCTPTNDTWRGKLTSWAAVPATLVEIRPANPPWYQCIVQAHCQIKCCGPDHIPTAGTWRLQHWHEHSMSTRAQVLALYRNILRTARTWQGGQQVGRGAGATKAAAGRVPRHTGIATRPTACQQRSLQTQARSDLPAGSCMCVAPCCTGTGLHQAGGAHPVQAEHGTAGPRRD